MKYLIMIENGYEYSDFSEVPSVICETKEDAERAKKLFDDWKVYFIDLKDKHAEAPWGGRKCVKVLPPPIPVEFSRFSNDVDLSDDHQQYHAVIYPVPEWPPCE